MKGWRTALERLKNSLLNAIQLVDSKAGSRGHGGIWVCLSRKQARGALVRARFAVEIDAPTSLFFGLEKMQGEDKKERGPG